MTTPNRAPIGCPMCPKMLRYVTTRTAAVVVGRTGDRSKVIADLRVYECASHGVFHVGPDGRFHAGR